MPESRRLLDDMDPNKGLFSKRHTPTTRIMTITLRVYSKKVAYGILVRNRTTIRSSGRIAPRLHSAQTRQNTQNEQLRESLRRCQKQKQSKAKKECRIPVAVVNHSRQLETSSQCKLHKSKHNCTYTRMTILCRLRSSFQRNYVKRSRLFCRSAMTDQLQQLPRHHGCCTQMLRVSP